MTEDTIEVLVIDGRVRCVYLNDFRIAGSKPWADEKQKITTYKLPAGEIRQHLKRKQHKQVKP